MTCAMQITTASGHTLLVRRLQPHDAPLLVRFFHGLSFQTRWQRFFRTYQGISPLWVRREARRIAAIRPQRQLALIALWTPPARRHPQMVAGIQLVRTVRHGIQAEVGMVVADAFQRQGVGLELLRIGCEQAKAEGITQLVAVMHAENSGMWRTLNKLGYAMRSSVSLGERSVTISLE